MRRIIDSSLPREVSYSTTLNFFIRSLCLLSRVVFCLLTRVVSIMNYLNKEDKLGLSCAKLRLSFATLRLSLYYLG